MKRFNKEKLKQIILSVIAFSLIIIGYLNYVNIGQNTMEVIADTNDVNLGDVQLVNSDPDNSEQVTNSCPQQNFNEAIVPNNEGKIENINMEFVKNETTNYFTETKLERNRMNSELIEVYQKMLNSKDISNDQKAIAVQEISRITNEKNSIMITENLIKNKGFEDVVILICNDVVSVVIKSVSLSQEQIVQIQNIVSRELKTDIGNINISNKY